jgi:glutathione S-transferase
MASKIQLYSLATPNGQKVSVALEEMELEYEPHTINIMKNEQFSPEFIAINPNSKIPALVDPNGPDGKEFKCFESGAILLYLAEKTGKFLSHNPRLKWETIQWVFFQMAGVGPMFGQFGHFFKYAKDKCHDPYPVERYTNETKRLLGVLEKRLEGRDFIIDDGYSIADMAIFPWVQCLEVFYQAGEKLVLQNFPKVMAWKSRCLERPKTAKGMKVCPFN